MIKNFLAMVGAVTLLFLGHKHYTKYMEEKVAKDMAEAEFRAAKMKRAREAVAEREGGPATAAA